MDRPDSLIADLMEEDRLLRQLLAECPESVRDVRGSGGTLTFKETLGHLAFWDNFAVQFFLNKLDCSRENLQPPIDFEQQSREELKRLIEQPFDEVVRRYGEATRGIIAFLREHWHELTMKQRADFHVPLKHRRHHRLLLAKSLGNLTDQAKSLEKAEEA